MSDQEQDFTLPKSFNPNHYEISLKKLDAEKKIFQGHVRVHFQCVIPDQKIYLNARDLVIENVQVQLNNGQSLKVVSQDYDHRLEAIVIDVGENISDSFTVAIDYQGKIQTNMSGFYRSNYKDLKTNEDKFMLSTQFEATDARGTFPCVDEPARKATFKVSVTADSHLTVLSNMPEQSSQVEGNETEHIFHTTPRMSTYLVAWAVGEYEFIEGKTEKTIYPTLQDYSVVDGTSSTQAALPIRVYTAVGKKNQGKFALSVATKVVDLFSQLFKIPYPLPKLDLLCVESYSHNAMENFSLITFRTTALLVDDSDDVSPAALQKVAYVVSHEIAHQWFGNLVTMQWWDELWLNEGFATWVGYYAVSVFFPHWDVESMVMLESHEAALQLDSLKESHPVKVGLRDPKDVDQAFDTISYLKGCSVLEMVSGYLGQDDFLAGVALYLEINKWGNATMEDLFDCIGKVAKVEILSKVKPWLLELGYPILDVKKSGDQLSLTQSKANTDSLWWVPLLPTRDGEFIKQSDLTTRTTQLEAGSKYTLFNTDGYAFYRVNYESLELIDSLCDNISRLSSRSKMGLLSDFCSLRPLSDYLHLVDKTMKVHDPKDVYVWKSIHSSLLKTRTIVYNAVAPELMASFDRYVLQLVEPWINDALTNLENPTTQDSNDPYAFARTLFYHSILTIAGKLSHPKVVALARKLYQRNEINAHNRSIVLGTVLSQPDTTRAIFDQVVEVLEGAVLEEMETILRCLGSVTNPELFEPCFQLLFKVEPMNVQFLPEAFLTNPHIHSSILSFVQQNSSALIDRLVVNQTVIGRFLSFTFAYFQGEETVHKIKSIFEGRDISAYDRVLRQTLEKIEANTRFCNENIGALEKFLK
ncbi:ZYRO0D10670p [Zygosaccharomyces rouxii]|uniref:Aminopeptidase n=1 Tax=Zygosaccharomyces rouxii (strain ATCC 2623 / CBS 732 / NBRC 1130 / NCYC 568 / NRRL Y-229) TaxID=559307 RepID=C5DVZ7_ZYGRC|nr:uncharacterized protein ZYRO0D10670g [Zygosaccharomyces rouxii]KAH9200875.1 peptidase family M1-domain-containing protein [Zygosaccharomyces rouxii]CAR27966.1 ZYRO0D10670p [Zygosaccharomyces rouxii]